MAPPGGTPYRRVVDLRTKLVFALVAVALGSMLAFGWLAFGSARASLRASALEQLEAVAESKRESIERVLLGWRERVQLVSSRTQLRASLRELTASGNPAARQNVALILEDALASTNTIESLAVVDTGGALVAAVGGWTSAPEEAEDLVSRSRGTDTRGYRGLSRTLAGRFRALYAEPLELDGEMLGWLHARIRDGEIIQVTDDYDGLGNTGETMVAFRDTAGIARILNEVRHVDAAGDDADAGGGPRILSVPDGLDNPTLLALEGAEGSFNEDVVDYRNEPVWAATRFIPETGWGLVVKVDASERQEAITTLRRDLQQLGVSLAAFAILVGTALGFHIARPIMGLAAVARQVEEGELGARATVHGQDEIGLLAQTFNDMAEELERRMNELKQFHTFFEVALDMLCIAGTDGYFKRTNPAFERTLGWTAEELRERPFFDLVHPDDVEATRAEVAQLAQGIPTVRFQNRYRCADGSYKTLLWTSQPDPETGLLYAAARDVTELTLARERLAAAGKSQEAPEGD